MQKRVEEYVAKWDMLKKEDKVIVGVSGGADSICLLFVLLELQKKIPFEIIVVHVNHGIRGRDADADERYVRQICEECQIPFEVYFEDVEQIAKERRLSTEEAGRDVRRSAFYHTMQKYGGTKIALAHHKNDSVETFLMNLARGTGIKGMGGIRPVTGDIIRPLLCLERKEIEQYLKDKQIAYCTDVTNASDDYTRNRIRNHVIPYLEEEVNARAVSHMSESMRQLQEIQLFLEEQTRKCFETCVKEEEMGYIVLEEAFKQIPTVLQPLVLKEVLVKISGREKDLEEIHLQDLQNLFQKQVGRQVDLPYEMQGRRVYEGVFIQKRQEEKIEHVVARVSFAEGNERVLYWKDRKIICQILNENSVNDICLQKSNTKWFDYDIIVSELSIRTRRPGDYITIHENGGTQKLKSFFINEKVPQEKRDEILLVADGNHILWIEGYRTNPVYHVTEHTRRVLKIQMN